MRGWRHGAMDQCVGTINHQPERFTRDAIAFEIAAAGRGCRDPGQLQGFGLTIIVPQVRSELRRGGRT